MTIALWILNIVLALAFLAAGLMKIARPKAALAGSGMGWVEDFSDSAVKGIGAIEVVGAIGLIVPMATGIAVILTPLAAVGLVLVMAGAVVVHQRRREPIVPPLVLGVISAVSAVLGFIALG